MDDKFGWFKKLIRDKTKADGIFNSQYWYGWIDGYSAYEEDTKPLRHIIKYWSS